MMLWSIRGGYTALLERVADHEDDIREIKEGMDDLKENIEEIKDGATPILTCMTL